MSTTGTRYLPGAAVSNGGAHDVRGARHLDHLSTGWGAHWGALFGGVVVSGLLLLFGGPGVFGAVFALAGALIDAPWRADETGGGAALRRVVGLDRSAVLQARYASVATMLATFLATICLAVLVGDHILGRDLGPHLYDIWVAAWVAITIVCVGVPVRVRFGDRTTWVAVALGAVVGLVVAMVAGSFAFEDGAIRSARSGVVACALLVSLGLLGGLASYRSALRAYARKDL